MLSLFELFKDDILENIGNQTTLDPIDFDWTKKNKDISQNERANFEQ